MKLSNLFRSLFSGPESPDPMTLDQFVSFNIQDLLNEIEYSYAGYFKNRDELIDYISIRLNGFRPIAKNILSTELKKEKNDKKERLTRATKLVKLPTS